MTHLYLFQIGPVQSFIAAARRTQDLYIGSRLLCDIVLAGMSAAEDMGGSLIFPAKESDPHNTHTKSVPHIFAFTIETDKPDLLGRTIEDKIRTRWKQIALQVREYLRKYSSRTDWADRFDSQVERWLEVYWVAVEFKDDYAKVYKAARQSMGMRKNLRHFPQMQNETGRKCTLTGAMAALDLDWEELRRRAGGVQLRENEALGAIAAIKRFAQDAGVFDKVKFPDLDQIAGGTENSEEPLYVAVLHMDGDNMGKFLSSLHEVEEHQSFSSKLSQFADQARKIVNGHSPGQLIYAGGDDILALLPTSEVLKCANELQAAFRSLIQPHHSHHLTMSAGIAIAPSNYPFDLMLDAARRAEKLAKDKYGRDAVCVLEVHGGQEREAGIKWDYLGPIIQVEGYFYLSQLSKSLGYDLYRLAHDMGDSEVDAEARRLELKRLLKRRTAEKLDDVTKADILRLADDLYNVAETIGKQTGSIQAGWATLANWIILVRFLEGRI